MNLTKQIQVRCKQEELQFENLLEERKTYIDRIAKCNTLIASVLEQCEGAQKERLETLLAASSAAIATTEEEKKLLQYSITANKNIQKTLSMDHATIAAMRKERDQLQQVITQHHTNKKNGIMEQFK